MGNKRTTSGIGRIDNSNDAGCGGSDADLNCYRNSKPTRSKEAEQEAMADSSDIRGGGLLDIAESTLDEIESFMTKRTFSMVEMYGIIRSLEARSRYSYWKGFATGAILAALMLVISHIVMS